MDLLEWICVPGAGCGNSTPAKRFIMEPHLEWNRWRVPRAGAAKINYASGCRAKVWEKLARQPA